MDSLSKKLLSTLILVFPSEPFAIGDKCENLIATRASYTGLGAVSNYRVVLKFGKAGNFLTNGCGHQRITASHRGICANLRTSDRLAPCLVDRIYGLGLSWPRVQ